MNTQNDINARLLKLFPVKALKDFYGIQGSQRDLVHSIVENNNIANVHGFCATHIPMTKQHIYVYSHTNVNFTSVNRSVFTSATVISESTSTLNKKFALLFDIDYQLALTNPVQEVTINYKWPVRVTITAHHVIVHITVLERSPASEFADNRRVFVTEKSIDEEDILRMITASLLSFSTISSCDINRGVKHLWATDTIDARATRFKKANSVSSETMDENYTLKADMRNVYDDLILTPLRVTVFKFMDNTSNRYVNHVTIDPSSGHINITIYPNDISQIDNIIEDIIQNN